MTIRQLTPTEAAYIAGIIDGEGSIMLICNKKNTYPSPVIAVASTTKELLDYLVLTIGAGTIRQKTNYKPSHHQPSYTYELRGDKVIQLLEMISPYLIIESKAKRTQLLVNDYKKITIRNGRYTAEQAMIKQDFYDAFIQIK